MKSQTARKHQKCLLFPCRTHGIPNIILTQTVLSWAPRQKSWATSGSRTKQAYSMIIPPSSDGLSVQRSKTNKCSKCNWVAFISYMFDSFECRSTECTILVQVVVVPLPVFVVAFRFRSAWRASWAFKEPAIRIAVPKWYTFSRLWDIGWLDAGDESPKSIVRNWG